MATLKELAARAEEKGELLTRGHRSCLGCAHPIIIRQTLLAAKEPVVVGCVTGCLEVTTTVFPYTAWRVPFIHTAFENSAATVSGIEAAYQALKRQGKYDKDLRFIATGGDGGTYDIGFQSLSGAAERGHRMLYLCLNNEAYMNTGIQRSSATPKGAHTTTAPAGEVIPGKQQHRKDLTACMVAHRIPYVAQTIASNWKDLTNKVEKALAADGPSFINVFSPCPTGWGYKPELTLEMGQLSVDTCFWPLYEVEDGKWKLNYRPKEKKPLVEWLKLQRRFAHLFKTPNGKELIGELQERVDREWEELLARCEKEG